MKNPKEGYDERFRLAAQLRVVFAAQGTFLRLKTRVEEESRFIVCEVVMPDDVFLESKNHSVSLNDYFRIRIKELVDGICDNGGLTYNNTGSSFWFSPKS